jgi:hypothetical protein
MKRIVAALVFAVAVPLACANAIGQERAGDAALGALSGAVVLGPVGAVAGALVGYTSGPSIAHSWGMRRSARAPARRARTAARGPSANSAPAAQPSAPSPKANPAPSSQASTPVRSAGGAAAMPPVQSLE